MALAISKPAFSLSALGGGEGWGEVGGRGSHAGTAHLTLPIAAGRVPSLSPQMGGEGR
jgi:hypothetical protein